MSDPLTPEQQIIEVLKDVSRDDAYQLLAGLMHTLLDLTWMSHTRSERSSVPGCYRSFDRCVRSGWPAT